MCAYISPLSFFSTSPNSREKVGEIDFKFSLKLIMVGVFRRSLSFTSMLTANRRSKPSISLHNRCVSLPCRPHPLISHLKNDIEKLGSWLSATDGLTSDWICEGLTRVRSAHNYLDDILHLPQSQESLNCLPQWVDKFLECFLSFIDVYGIFQTLMLAFKNDLSAAQVAVRKNDAEKRALYIKARTRMAKETGKLVAAVRRIRACRSDALQHGDDKLVSVIGQVIEATAAVSVALFDGISRTLWQTKRSGLMKFLKRKTENEGGIEEFQHSETEIMWRSREKEDRGQVNKSMKKMETLEKCIEEIDRGSERVFRSLISARVSLLNILTR